MHGFEVEHVNYKTNFFYGRNCGQTCKTKLNYGIISIYQIICQNKIVSDYINDILIQE